LIHHPKRTRESQAAIKDRIETEMPITKLTETLEALSTGVILRSKRWILRDLKRILRKIKKNRRVKSQGNSKLKVKPYLLNSLR
jgi:hypothetical protein